jgi:hypothetical protein
MKPETNTNQTEPMRIPFICLLSASLLGVACAFASDSKQKTLTNADVITMLENKIPEGVILAKIQAAEANFDTSTRAIIKLNKKGASEALLNAMLHPITAEGAQVPIANSPSPGSPADAPSAAVSTLSYGTATGLIKKGVTTQHELLELFGGPSVMTTDKDGAEVWMYDKTTSTLSGNSDQNGKQATQSDATAMARYLEIPLIAGVGQVKGSNKEESSHESRSQNAVTSSIKTITFIIKFNPDKTVKDYSVRQAAY